MSLNTVYENYSRLRWRLIEVDYYRDASHSLKEAGLSEITMQELRMRRGLGDEDIYAHSAEAIVWAEEWPPSDVLRHLRKIIDLTGPIDLPMALSDHREAVVEAYVRYAKTKLLHDRLKAKAADDPTRLPRLENAQEALDKEWRKYRSLKQQERRRR